MTPAEAANVAWREYTAALQQLCTLPGSQRDLFGATDARAKATFWAETWIACEREAVRVH